MPLSQSDLESIQADALADDVPIDLERMRLWSPEDAYAYFESGGTVEPSAADAAPVDAPAATTENGQPVPSKAPLGRRPRVALLHGTAGCETVLKAQLGPLTRQLRECADVFFVEGHRKVAENNEQVASVRKFFGDDVELKEYAVATLDARGWRTYDHLDEGISGIEASIGRQGGADVLVAFSQGANFSTMVASRAARGDAGALPPFRAVVLLSPVLPGWASQKPELFEVPLGTPALILGSQTDSVAGNGPQEVANLYATARVHSHAGPGHRPLPTAANGELSNSVKIIKEFVLEHAPP